ncbi:ROK family protein [Scytonema sp. NUACC26]|uniref:ROK family protein n=1 Tax=Scytonema sp. NUACC26 TaxID=3140176 RepID=UPI0034DC74AF
MENSQVIGIDLGGTAIKLGRFASDGSCLQSLTVPTPQPATPLPVVKAIVDAIAQVDPEQQATAIGIGTPGPSDAAGRIAKIAINLPEWRDVPLADWLEAKTGKPTVVENDANCAGLGEAWLGAGCRFKNFILLTLGTGVGGAIILDGKLFAGHYRAAGELGLITLIPDGLVCNSGNQGSLEQYVSVTAIRRRTGKDPAELSTLAKAGDAEALIFWQEYGIQLAAGLASLIYVLTPEAVVIGGGVSACAEFFLPSVHAEIERRVVPASRVGLHILPAELGNAAGMAGAAKLAFLKLGNGELGVPSGDKGQWGTRGPLWG